MQPAAGVFSTTTCFVSVWIHYCTTRLSLANVVVYCNVTQQPTLNSFAHQAIDRNLWLMSDWFGRAAIFDRNATYPSGSWSRGGRWRGRRLVRTYKYVRRCAHRRVHPSSSHFFTFMTLPVDLRRSTRLEYPGTFLYSVIDQCSAWITL